MFLIFLTSARLTSARLTSASLMIKKSSLFAVLVSILIYAGIIFTIVYFAIQYTTETKINNQYQTYTVNITDYNITLNSNNEFDGYIQFRFNNDQSCWMYNITFSESLKVYYYLNFYYPKYTLTSIYYNKDNCLLYLPYETWRALGMTIGFSFIFLFFGITWIIAIRSYLRNKNRPNSRV
jgi:hypothetical protein